MQGRHHYTSDLKASLEVWVLRHLGRLEDSFRDLHECPPYMGEKVTRNLDEMQA